MDLSELFLGQIPEAIYFALFLILTKKIKEKRLIFTLLMILKYLLLKQFTVFNMWFQMSYLAMTFLTLKVVYKEKAQVTDIFTFGIASIILIAISFISFMLFRPNMIVGSIVNRILLFVFLLLFRKKLPKIQSVYKLQWNRNDKTRKKVKSITFRAVNLIIFNIMFYIINLGMTYMLFLRR